MIDFAQKDIARSVSYKRGCVAPDRCYKQEGRMQELWLSVACCEHSTTPLPPGILNLSSNLCTFHLSLLLGSY